MQRAVDVQTRQTQENVGIYLCVHRYVYGCKFIYAFVRGQGEVDAQTKE